MDEFVEAQRSLDTKRMRQYAQALSPFSLVSEALITSSTHHFKTFLPSPFSGFSESYGEFCSSQYSCVYSSYYLIGTYFICFKLQLQQFQTADDLFGHVEKQCKKVSKIKNKEQQQ